MAYDDYIFISIAKGDNKDVALGKRVGDIIDYVDGSAVEDPDIHFSENHRKIYDVRKVLKADWLAPVISSITEKPEIQTSYREKRLDLAMLGISTDSYAEFIPQNVTELVAVPADVLRTGVDNGSVSDTGLVSSGSYTVGTSMNYATWAAAMADVTNLTGGLTFTQKTATTEASSSAISITYGGYTLTCTSDTDPLGSPANGWLTSINHNDEFLGFQGTGGTTSKIVVSKLNIKRTQDASAATKYLMDCRTFSSAVEINIYSNIFDVNSLVGRCLYIGDVDITFNLFNNLFLNASTRHFLSSAHAAASKCENNTFYGSADKSVDNDDKTLTYLNCVFVGMTGNNFINTNNSTSLNSATDKASIGCATDTNPSVNIVSANEFVSTSQASADFLKVKAGGSIDDGGGTTSITANTIGIRGNARPGTDTYYSIGADEYNPGDAGSWHLLAAKNQLSNMGGLTLG